MTLSPDVQDAPHQVFIVDDDTSVRDSLSMLLSMRGLSTQTFASAEDFLEAFQSHWRGCLVLDIRMPGMSGLELQQHLQQRGCTLPVIIVTGHGDVAAARQAFKARAVDFIEKPWNVDQLAESIDQALSEQREVSLREDRLQQLTQREREIVQWIAKGLHSREIGEQLGISPRTVETHRAHIMNKLHVKNAIELVQFLNIPDSHS
jgi:FixJ family two-component response regulator